MALRFDVKSAQFCVLALKVQILCEMWSFVAKKCLVDNAALNSTGRKKKQSIERFSTLPNMHFCYVNNNKSKTHRPSNQNTHTRTNTLISFSSIFSLRKRKEHEKDITMKIIRHALASSIYCHI